MDIDTSKLEQSLDATKKKLDKLVEDYKGKQTDNDPVNHPSHYTSSPSGIECIQVTEHMNFNLGNAMKYIWRSGDKGNAIQDLEKAVWYVKREIERLARCK